MSEELMRSFRDPIFPLLIEQGEMAVVLSNEQVAKVLRPGKYRRLFDLPVRGVKRIIKFTTHEATVQVQKVALVFRDPDSRSMTYPASVSATAIVTFNADSEAMERAVARFDPDQMGSQIRRSVVDAVSGHLRRSLQEFTHDSVATSSDLGPLVSAPDLSILDGLLTVVRIENVAFQPNAQLAELDRVRREALVKTEVAEIEESLKDLESIRESLRDGERRKTDLVTWVQISQETGVPLEVVMNPELLTTTAQANLELRAELIRNPDSLRALIKQPDVLKALTGAQDQSPTWSAHEVRAQLPPSDTELQLGLDATIGRALGHDSLELELRGSVLTQFAVRGSRAAEAVLVTSNREALTLVVSRLRTTLRDKTGADTVVVQIVDYEPKLADFVASFYRAVAPPQASNYRTLTLVKHHQTNRHLQLALRVDGAHRSVSDIVRGEDDRRTDQLQSLLMAEQLTIEVV